MKKGSQLVTGVMVSEAQAIGERLVDTTPHAIIALGLEIIKIGQKRLEKQLEAEAKEETKTAAAAVAAKPPKKRKKRKKRRNARPGPVPPTAAPAPKAEPPRAEPQAPQEPPVPVTSGEAPVFPSRSIGGRAPGTPLKDIASEQGADVRVLSAPAERIGEDDTRSWEERGSKLSFAFTCGTCRKPCSVGSESELSELQRASRRTGRKPRCDGCGGNKELLAQVA